MDFDKIVNTLLFNRKIIIKFTLLTVLFIYLILFFIYPASYKSTVSLLPPEKNASMGGLGSLLGGGSDFSSLLTGGLGNATSQLYMEVLKSRSAAEYVIKRNNLISYYNAEDMVEAVKELQNNLDIEISKEGILKLNVEVSSSFFPIFIKDKPSARELSAKLSNSYIEALDKINRTKLSSKARNAREYVEQQIERTKTALDSVESRLMNFQKSNKTISLPEQVKVSMEAAAKIKAEIVKTEVELGIAQSNLREDSKTLISLRNKLEQLREQYNKMEVGSQDYLLTFSEVPELGRELATLLREVKIQNEVYLMLQQQYYKEKIQENRDLPTVEVLDPAIPPKKASGPRTLVSSAIGGVFSFLLISMILLVSEQKKLRRMEKIV